MCCQELADLIQSGELRHPPILAKELDSRSKSSFIIKFVAFMQVIWFGIQTLSRAISHLQTTALEISVLAFVLCSLLTYISYWESPQDVEYPIPLTMENIGENDGKTIASMRNHHHIQRKRAKDQRLYQRLYLTLA